MDVAFEHPRRRRHASHRRVSKRRIFGGLMASAQRTPTRVRPAPRPDPAPDVAGGRQRPRWRVVTARVLTALAGLLVFMALVMPKEVGQLTPAAFVRIPIEGLVAVTVLLVLPPRARRWVAALGGLLLGALTCVKALDMGFIQTLARPFDPVLDWILLDDAFRFLTETFGKAGAIGAAVVAALLVLAVLALMTLAVLRLTGVAVRHRSAANRLAMALGAVWLICAAVGAQIVAPVPVAARSVASLAYDKARQVPTSLRDEGVFAAQSAVDTQRGVPAEQMLGGLRGKDFLLAFVESYGRSAVEDPRYAPQVDAVLDAGTRRLEAAGYSARSAFLTSPVAGGGSWLAEATFLSGLWIDNQQRYLSLTSSDRMTLSSAFKRANWPTVAVMPGTTYAWPEGKFYGYDKVYDFENLGYKGLNFAWSTMPDQYVLEHFHRTEHGRPDRDPLMAEIVLTSSHVPWTPVPRMIDWADVGDGSVFNAMALEGDPPDVVWQDADRVRDGYRTSIEYTLNSLISYVETYGDDNLVLVFLGDHQPAPLITGEGASRDVPITIVARDKGVLDRISSWGWEPGLNPSPQAPVQPMDAFRDRFLTAYSG